MNLLTIIQFAIATLVPIIATVILHAIQVKRNIDTNTNMEWQVVVGLIFGAIAIMGTEIGIETHDATMNVRDAAPLCAGLFFGGPAGIIAGAIGGVERWFAALWGRGIFTRVACSLGTMAAGLFAALLRKFMFDNARPKWPYALFAGIVTEVFHLTLIFFTNFQETAQAFVVVRACTPPMVLCNALAVTLSAIALSFIEGDHVSLDPNKRKLSQMIQGWMLVSLLIAFLIAQSFSSGLLNNIAKRNLDQVLGISLADVRNDVQLMSDIAILDKARQAGSKIGTVGNANDALLSEIKNDIFVAEVNVVDDKGIIVASTEKSYIGFDMSSGEQSKEFMGLTSDGDDLEYVQQFGPISSDSKISRKYAGVIIGGGFVQVGLDATQMQLDTMTQMIVAVENRHIGETGFLFLTDEFGANYSNASMFDKESIPDEVLKAIRAHDPYEVFIVNVYGMDLYATYDTVEGFYIVAMQPIEEAEQSREISTYIYSFMEVLIFALVFVLVYVLIKFLVVDKMREIDHDLKAITEGDLNVVVDAKGSTELVDLSNGINSTVDALKGYIAEAEARIDQELEYARSIQHSALPSVFPPFPTHTEIDIYAIMDPAKEVGGDFYDFYLLDDDHLAFVIADVSGKGIPAALFMMRAKTVLKSYAETGLMVQDVVTCANSQLCDGNDANMFVTAFMGVLDLRTGHIEFANAGHNMPCVLRPDSGYSFIDTAHKLALGCYDGIEYVHEELDLAPGDVLYMYTDGVVEANNEQEELYGNDRLLVALNKLADADMRELCDGVHADVDLFAGEAPQFDDMTMLAIRYKGRK